MALSQIQCLDDNNVNPRIHESKPEFFYCEDQRLALEALLRYGREAFFKHLESRGLRGFLSDPELEALTAALEPFDPDSELFSGEAEDDPEPLSLQYWPEVSDTSLPQMDLGWPDCGSYRGVTRTFVYTQPPMEGQAHIKEVVRKMIAQAQKVIAVVMDVFTDVDIFQDLLDAGFKRKVSVYILLERTTLPHFLSMCQRANMHAGHLKHLRVRCTAGAEFHTRYCTKVRGQLGHRFMFIDGDKAVSGSYSFTWMSSRLDRNLITVITGQTVDAFDQLFRFLYMTSSFIDLRQVATEPEPEPDTRHQVLSVAPSSAAVVRKLYNPKYALVALSSPVNSSCNDGLKDPEISEDAKNKNKRKRPHEDLLQDVPPLHPGLIDLEKACLLSYLPTWPEPDPSSDVIGFINIRDFKKPTQVHLQRSEMFETSQAIKFSSPFIKPQETLPEVAQPRNQVAQSNSKSEDVLVDKSSVGLLDNKPKNMATEQKSLFKKEKLNPEKSDTKVVQTENKSCSNEATNPDLGPHFLSPNALLQSSTKALTPKNEQSQVLLTATLLEPLKESKFVKAHEIQTFLKTQSTFANPVNTLESSSGQKSTLHKQAQLNREDTEENKTKLYQVSHNTISDTQPKILSSEETHNLKNSLRPWNSAMSAASPIQSVGLLSKNNLSNSTTVPSTTAIISYNSHTSSIPTLSMLPSISSFSALLPSSTSAITSSDPQDSKPNTDQPLIQDSTTLQIVTKVSVSENLQSISAKNLENTVELQRNSISKTGNQENKLKTNICKDTNQETETVTYQTTMEKEADSKHNDKAEVHSFTDTPIETQSEVSLKTATVDFKTVKPESVDLKMHRDCITTTTDSKTSNKILTNLEFAKVANTAQTYHARSHEPQVISYSNFTLQDINILKPLNSSTARIDCVSHSTPIPKEKDGYSIKSAANALSQPDKQAQLQSLHSHTFQEQPCKTKEGAHTVIKTLHLHLSNAEGTQLSSETNKQESQLSAPIVQTLAPKVLPQNLPTLDSRTFSADPQTPTTEISDGYFSPREDSTTSEEYFECNESPSHEHVVDLAMRENNSPTYSNRPFSKNTTHTSPAGMGNILSAVALASAHQITASSESSTSVDPSASLFVSKGQNRGPKVTNKKIGKEESKIEVKRSNTDEKDMVHQSINGKNNKEFNQIRSPLNNDSETMKIDLNLSKDSRRQDDEGMAKSESAQKETKCLSIGELKPDSVLSEGKKVSSPKDKALNQSPQTPSNMDRRRRPTRETTGQKPLHPSPKSQPRQLPSIRGSSPSRPLRSPKTHSGYQVQETCPVRDLNQTESRAVQKNRKISDKPLFRKSQSRSPSPLKAAPIETVSGQKQVSQSPLRLLTRQPSAAQIHSKPDQPKCLTAKQHGSSLRTLSNLQAQVEPHASTDKVSEQAVNQPDEARVPFNLSFGRLYNFKGLREKWTKPPTQTRRSSTSTPVKERKSTT